jgi:hypothetical protein
MRSSYKLLKAAISGLLVSAIACITMLGQGAHQLYLIQGFAANNAFPFKVQSSLIAVDSSKSAVIFVRNLVDESDGATSIITDHDRRLVAIGVGDVSFGTKRVSVLRMDAPSEPRTITVAFYPQFFCSRPSGSVQACGIGMVEPKGRLWGLDLTDSISPSAAVLLPLSEYQNVHTDGFWSPADLMPSIDLYLQNGRLLFQVGGSTADLGIPAPPELKVGSNDRLILDLANDEMFVVGLYGPATSPGPGTLESHKFYTYDKKNGTWQTATFNGAVPSVRGFGYWMAFPEAGRKRAIGAYEEARVEPVSPGAASRVKVLNPKTSQRNQTSIETLFKTVPYYFSGGLHLYNIQTHQNFTIQTGDGDSEILLVDGSTVYYRVNDALYTAQIGQTQIENTQLVVRDDSVQLSHWAFMGPALTQ